MGKSKKPVIAKQVRKPKRGKSSSFSQSDNTGNTFRPDSPGAKAFSVLARCRRTGESPESISRQKGTYFSVVRRRLPGQFRKVRGKWVPSKSDRLFRRKALLTADGYVMIRVRGSKKADELNRYNQIVDRFIHGKDHDPSALESFEKKRISGHPYLTDPDKVFRLGDAGLIKTEELGSDQVARGGKK
jgi:hypothetical protein